MTPEALSTCAALSKKAWKAAVDSSMDSAHDTHWRMRIQAKLVAPPPPPFHPHLGATVLVTAGVLVSSGSGACAGVVDAYDARTKKWHMELDHGAPMADVMLTHSDVGACATGAGQGGEGDVVHMRPLRMCTYDTPSTVHRALPS
jgi:hypothetical protein